MLDSLLRGEAPFAMHLLYPQVLNDNIPEERAQGIEAGLTWLEKAELVALYIDLGITPGMKLAVEAAARLGIAVCQRTLPKVLEQVSLAYGCGSCSECGLDHPLVFALRTTQLDKKYNTETSQVKMLCATCMGKKKGFKELYGPTKDTRKS